MSAPDVYFGAVYYRKSNPPERDWERDYRTAHEDGHNLFRHWVPWGAVEVAPGRFDWADYDRHLELAAQYGIRTVLAEFCDNVPEWFYHRYPHARRENMQGQKRRSGMHVSCVTGGAYAMCLDNPEVEAGAAHYLSEMATRYRGHPALHAYDIWNECSLYGSGNLCYCPATQRAFRAWLKERYGELEAVNRAWHRYSFTEWDQVELPRQIALYPEVFDATAFWNDNAFRWMQWRADVLRAADPDHPVTAHGNAKSFRDIAPACGDDWRAAQVADIFGYTYWQANDCHPLMAGDMTRSAAGGKQFWRAEAVGDHSWNGRRPDRPRPEADAMHDPANIRIDALTSLAAGARAYQNPRWRALLDGPLFGAYGWYGMDGGRTKRSDMVRSIARWANHEAPAELWRASPVRGDVGLLICEEAQAWCWAFTGSTEIYARCVKGAYDAFLHANVQCDPIRLAQVADYELVYLPFPVALRDETADALRRWVADGGCLVSEACFGYFDGRGHALPAQPNRGYRDVFGCTEATVSFAPDRWKDLPIQTADAALRGALYRQSYRADEAEVTGTFADGATAMVDHRHGSGKVRLVGCMPAYSYRVRRDEATRGWFASLLTWAGRRALTGVGAPDVIARLWRGEGRTYLWVLNSAEEALSPTVTVRESIDPAALSVLRGGAVAAVRSDAVWLTVPGRDAAVLRIR